MTATEDFETGLFYEEATDQWLSEWEPEMTYDEWEDARTNAGAILAPKTETMTLAQRLTMKARN